MDTQNNDFQIAKENLNKAVLKVARTTGIPEFFLGTRLDSFLAVNAESVESLEENPLDYILQSQVKPLNPTSFGEYPFDNHK